MTVREFIKQDIEIDVYDDVTEELGICFCGPMELTDEGKQHFKEVLDFEIVICRSGTVVKVDDPDEAVWQKRLEQAKEFFFAAAGYCNESDYIKWFVIKRDGAQKPKLTEREMTLCKASGAKWISRDKRRTSNAFVIIWKNKPVLNGDGLYCKASDDAFIGSLMAEVFPSLEPGDCINVEELLK